MSETTKNTRKSASRGGGTLKQIAERAGCSVPTVSRVLNGYKTGFSVKPEVAARIHAAVKEFHYAPNPLLRSIRAKNSKVIAIFDPVSNTFGSLRDAKSGFLEEIAATDFFDVTKYVSLYHAESYRLPLTPAGALLFDISEPAFLNFMEESRIPYVVINGICREHGCSILFDEAENVRCVISELHRLGHRRIVFFSNYPDPGGATMHYSGRVRMESFRRETLLQDCDEIPGDLFETGDAAAFLARAVDAFGATAVVCNDHACAMNLVLTGNTLERIRKHEFCLVSLSDDFPLERGDTPIAAVAADGISVGRTAARVLLERIEANEKKIHEENMENEEQSTRPNRLLLPGKLLVRGTLFPNSSRK